ncbi:RNA polymerase subunit sigma-70, partial [Clostridioides difficile]
CRDKVRTLRVTRRKQELSKQISYAKIKLQKETKKPPSATEIAYYIEVSDEDVPASFAVSYGDSPTSLDTSSSGDSSDKYIKLIYT